MPYFFLSAVFNGAKAVVFGAALSAPPVWAVLAAVGAAIGAAVVVYQQLKKN